MIEADTYCFIAWLYSAFVCLTGMSLFWWLNDQPGWDGIQDFVPILWVGLSMWGLSWMKVWLLKPTFNSGLSFDFRQYLADIPRQHVTWRPPFFLSCKIFSSSL